MNESTQTLKTPEGLLTKTREEFTKLLYNIRAEQDVLSSIMLDNNNVNKVSEFLRSEHFYDKLHQKIYEQILSLIDKDKVADPTSLQSRLTSDDSFKEAGGVAYLLDIIANGSNSLFVKDRAYMVYDMFLRRNMVDLGAYIVQDSFDTSSEEDATDKMHKAEQKLYQLATSNSTGGDFAHIDLPAKNLIEAIKIAKDREGISGLATNFADLDNLLGGLQNSDLVILAGRPSMGKTAFAVNIAYNIAKNLQSSYVGGNGDAGSGGAKKGGVGFVSLEMSSEQIVSRILSMTSGLNSSVLRSARINEQEFKKLVETISSINQIPFFIDDTPALSIGTIRARARRLKRKHDISLLMVDYLQLLRGSENYKDSNRVQEVSEITRGLKAIAKELNIPVVALSQLSRMVEQREDKRPQLSDLRESGSIEQDADVVMFIYRADYYLERTMPKEPEDITNEKAMDTVVYKEWLSKFGEKWHKIRNIAEIIVAKQRNGPIGNVALRFNKEFTSFDNLERGHFSGSDSEEY